MAIGWLTDTDEADTYFETRLENQPWTVLQDEEKEAALTTAYNRLYYYEEFDIPTSPTAAQLAILKIAQEEFAFYLVTHLSDEDRRKGLQAQGVKKAGIVKEDYSEDMLKDMPIPPFVLQLMKPFSKYEDFFATDIARDEDESVDEDVTDF